MKEGRDALRGLRYKPRMMGIPMSGSLYIYGDNLSVVQVISRPESVLGKKNILVCYPAVHESVVMGEPMVGHKPSSKNVANLMAKVLNGQTRKYFVGNVLYDIHDDHKASIIHLMGAPIRQLLSH